MKKILLYLSFCCSAGMFAQQPSYWQQQVNYTISVRLNDAEHSLTGFEKIEYTNNSPDTLKHIWFHIWPNAYKNDKTAFSEQQLQNGRTDFYFAADSLRGYINQLNFAVDNKSLQTEAHPKHIDIIKVLLNSPLPPNSSVVITTPFHVQLPYNFSRSGHIGNHYQATQWYPKPAVYDALGWHEMPYLDIGEFYSEFGNFDVTIEVPKEYIVAATGVLQNAEQLNNLKNLGRVRPEKQGNFIVPKLPPVKPRVTNPRVKTNTTSKKKNEILVAKPENKISAKKEYAEFQFKQDNIHDFAWFASKQFIVEHDTCTIENKVVDVFSFYPSNRINNFKGSTATTKKTLKNYSNWLGVYPYQTATVVVGAEMQTGGMEYPTITYITTTDSSDKKLADEIISHEVGHNWLYGILASNERDHAWMDEGMNTFYDNKIKKNDLIIKGKEWLNIDSFYNLIFQSLQTIQKLPAVDTASDAYSYNLYGLIIYNKAGMLLKQLENYVGKEAFAAAMKQYYQDWKFKHPNPKNFKQSIEQSTGKNLDNWFKQLYNHQQITAPVKKQIKTAFIYGFKQPSKYHYINIAPTASFNLYDGMRLGLAIHNYQLPVSKFQFFANPSLGIGSGKFNYFGRASYSIYKKRSWLEASVSLQHYSYNDFVSTSQNQKFMLGITRLVPSLKLTLYNGDLKSTKRAVVGFKTFYLNQQNLNFQSVVTTGGIKEIITTPSTKSYINRLYGSVYDNRVLYPYNLNLTIDQSNDFIRAGFTAKQFFNYANNTGGIEARFFAGKFFYLGTKTIYKQFTNDSYHLNLTGPKGYEDYTYSDYFIGRGEFEGWHSNQIMERDGFFKVRTDYLGSKVGKTDDWLIAANFSGNIPDKINPLSVMPIKLPIKFFVDIGTYAEAWRDNAETGRFLYAAGFQISLLKNTVNIYAPILMSKVYRDYNASILGENPFWKTVSFNINLQNLHFNKIFREIPL